MRLKILAILLGTTVAVQAQTMNLQQALKQMDASSAKFQDVKADILVQNYTAVVQDTETQTGMTAFRRVGGAMEMVTHLTTSGGQPYADLRYADGKLEYYSPAQKQETIFTAGANSGEADSLLATGFGATGEQLESAWTVTFDGMEPVGGVQTAKLELVSKNANIRNNYFSKLTIWVDLSRDITLKQVTEQPDGDKRTVTYSQVEYNTRLPGSLFTLKIPSGAQVTRK
ncbi:MAG: outer membrane lipoprotein-sorting protein [Acidobacteriaceae bacterium]